LKACVQERILFYLTKPAWETARSYSKCSISLLSQSDKVMLRRRNPARNHLFLSKNVRPTLAVSNLPTGATSSRNFPVISESYSTESIAGRWRRELEVWTTAHSGLKGWTVHILLWGRAVLDDTLSC